MNAEDTEELEDTELRAIVSRWAAGECSAEIALMELLTSAEDVARVGAAVAGTPELARLLEENRPGCARICAMLKSGVDVGAAPAASVDEGIAMARRLFDWSVEENEETSVALYSLGNPAILARATQEVVALLDRWGLFTPDTRALEIGCGIGRLLAPIAARVASIVGIDVAPRMVAVASRRCASLPRIEIRSCSGRDLAGFGDASLDLVLAVDSFPYIVQAGPELAAAMFREVGRVLAPGGHFALLGYSYRGQDAADGAEVAALAAAAGLEAIVSGARGLVLWNALTFLLRRQAAWEATPSSAR